jgi:hypothetical protein
MTFVDSFADSFCAAASVARTWVLSKAAYSLKRSALELESSSNGDTYFDSERARLESRESNHRRSLRHSYKEILARDQAGAIGYDKCPEVLDDFKACTSTPTTWH